MNLTKLCILFCLASSVSASEQYSNEMIDISGNYQNKRVTQADRIKKLRKKLEAQNEEMMKKRIEQMRFNNELIMMKKVEKALNKQLKSI